MTGSLSSHGNHRAALLAALATAAALVYFGSPTFQREVQPPPGHFTLLADAFVHGRLSIEATADRPVRQGELIRDDASGRLYCPYPPLPAVLLMPFVLVAGYAVKVEAACRAVSVVNVLLIALCLERLPQRMGRPPLSTPSRLMLTLLFTFGAAPWSNAMMAGDWHLAHAVALCSLLLALREYTRANRPIVVGLFVGLAMLSRPTTAFAGLFFALPLVNRSQLGALARWAAGPVVALVVLAAYNFARFGSALDFGYDRMLLTGEGQQLIDAYGQFHLAFIPRNAFWFFLAPPWPTADGAAPWLAYDPRGLSLFLATPAALYALMAFQQAAGRRVARDAAIATGLCLVPLLMYFNTGYWQFGHRFSMDYLPMLMILVLAGMEPRPGRLAWGLAALSIGVHAWGILWVERVARLPDWFVPTM